MLINGKELGINPYANLSNANLSNANLSNTNLSNTDLSNTDLSNTDLSNTDLSNTDLSNTDLSNTDLSNTDLSNTDLSNAQMFGAYLANAKLSNCRVSYNELKNIKLKALVPTIKNIHKTLYAVVSKDIDKLDTSIWHRSCGTIHCHAGWIVFLAGDVGFELEAEVSTRVAAALIYVHSDKDMKQLPDFYGTNADAFCTMKKLAGL